ncbi:MAG: hypothetical protein ACE5IW_09940 [bacterium]
MKRKKPVASKETRRKLKEAFEKIKNQQGTPFHNKDLDNEDKEENKE